ncbi:hypothetical protein C8Q70DRAFT_1035498 [Cubamyces menziesii]|nr:hypothetical protein C8Q70DRAFT_1035498 [Cubamyces menziesii]
MTIVFDLVSDGNPRVFIRAISNPAPSSVTTNPSIHDRDESSYQPTVGSMRPLAQELATLRCNLTARRAVSLVVVIVALDCANGLPSPLPSPSDATASPAHYHSARFSTAATSSGNPNVLSSRKRSSRDYCPNYGRT